MVGKLQDIVTAAVVVGATERTNRSSSTQPTLNAESTQPQVSADGTQARFVVDTQGMQAEDDSLFQRDDKQSEFHLEPGSLDEETVDLMTQELNDLMNKINCNLEFNYHKEVDVMSIKMVDKETQEVIKELPPEEMIENMMKAKIWLGAFIDKTI